MSLQDDIYALQQKSMAKMPPDVLQTMMAATKKLVEGNIVEKAKQIGDAAPAFSLPNMEGETISSKNFLKRGALVINFYRGAWCPYCNLELKALDDVHEQIRENGASLISISPNLPEITRKHYEENPFSFEILSDEGNRVAREYGLVFRLADELIPIYKQFGIKITEFDGNDSYEIPIPATYIVNPAGTIIHAFVNADYTKRMNPEEIITILGKLNDPTN